MSAAVILVLRAPILNLSLWTSRCPRRFTGRDGIVAQSEKMLLQPFSRKKIFVGLSGRFYAKIGIVGACNAAIHDKEVLFVDSKAGL